MSKRDSLIAHAQCAVLIESHIIALAIRAGKRDNRPIAIIAQAYSPHTNSISNSAFLCNYISLLSDLCACVDVKKNGIVKEAIVLQ